MKGPRVDSMFKGLLQLVYGYSYVLSGYSNYGQDTLQSRAYTSTVSEVYNDVGASGVV